MIKAQPDLAHGTEVEGWNKLQKVKTGEVHTKISFRLLGEDEPVNVEMAEGAIIFEVIFNNF